MTVRDPTALWFHSPRPHPTARLRLFCCAHAGAAGHVFHAWPAGLPPDIEVCAVQLPGRAFRLAEPAYTAVAPLVAALDAAAAPLLDRPFAIFGHSMGALVAFEWTRALRRRGGPQPERLCLSAFRGPHLPDPASPLHPLADDAFVTALQQRHGVLDDALADPELRALMLPVLRADFTVLETYAHAREPALDLPLHAFAGSDDRGVPPRDVAAWALHAGRGFSLDVLPGGHFFLHTARADLLARLSRLLSAPRAQEHP